MATRQGQGRDTEQKPLPTSFGPATTAAADKPTATALWDLSEQLTDLRWPN
jgi:hypothetical protein